MSTFQGVNLFGSGPHRFLLEPVGRYTEGAGFGPVWWPSSQDHGVREIRITQEGRLSAATEAALWVLVDAVKAKAESEATGTLNDGNGRSWTNMQMRYFELLEDFDRGRRVSVRYSVRYYKQS